MPTINVDDAIDRLSNIKERPEIARRIPDSWHDDLRVALREIQRLREIELAAKVVVRCRFEPLTKVAAAIDYLEDRL